MKTLSLEQMEKIKAGDFKTAMSCVSQVAGGISTLTTLAAIGIFAIGPVGWIAFGFGAVGLIAGVAADPTACDS